MTLSLHESVRLAQPYLRLRKDAHRRCCKDIAGLQGMRRGIWCAAVDLHSVSRGHCCYDVAGLQWFNCWGCCSCAGWSSGATKRGISQGSGCIHKDWVCRCILRACRRCCCRVIGREWQALLCRQWGL